MHFEQIYLGCLAQASYLLGSEGVGMVVDPRRDVDEYLAKAEAANLDIRHVIATHVHADFVAGLRELAARTGATVWMGRAFEGDLECRRIGEGEEIELGSRVSVRVLETPGHTPESICLLVEDRGDPSTPRRLLTGDTLFIGDAGRPDLVGARGHSAEEMAGMLFDSIQGKIALLDDSVEVWPGHGAGSACGKNISSDTWSTLGKQRLQNWALGETDRARFVEQSTTGLADPPAYFQHAAGMNRSGPPLVQELLVLSKLSATEAREKVDSGAVLLDVRDAARHGGSHPTAALNIGLQGQYASWAGTLIPTDATLVLLAETDAEAEEGSMRLGRVGLDQVIGWVPSGELGGWAEQTVPQIGVTDLAEQMDGLQVVDVRRPGEYGTAHVPGAVSMPLSELPARVGGGDAGGLDPRAPTAVICAGGYRSSAALHFLRRLGFTDLRNVRGGTNAWVAAKLPVEK